MGGDFNGTFENRLDHVEKKKIIQQKGRLPKAFFELVKQWRIYGEKVIQKLRILLFTQQDISRFLELT